MTATRRSAARAKWKLFVCASRLCVCSTLCYCSDEEKKRPRPSEEELTNKRKEAFDRALVSEQRDGAQTLVKTLIFILIDIITFVVHSVVAGEAPSNLPAQGSA